MVYLTAAMYFKYFLFFPIETEYMLRKQSKKDTLLG